jgi:hypothetical protein
MIVTVLICRRSRGPGEEDRRGGGSEEEERREEHEDLREDEEQARPPPQQDRQGRRHTGEADSQVLTRATRKRGPFVTKNFLRDLAEDWSKRLVRRTGEDTQFIKMTKKRYSM